MKEKENASTALAATSSSITNAKYHRTMILGVSASAIGDSPSLPIGWHFTLVSKDADFGIKTAPLSKSLTPSTSGHCRLHWNELLKRFETNFSAFLKPTQLFPLQVVWQHCTSAVHWSFAFLTKAVH